MKSLINKIGAGEYKDGSSLCPGTTYHPIPFDEFKDVPVHKTACYKELEIVKKYLPKGDTLLDIGCAEGFYTFNLRDRFKKVVGIERDENVLALLKALKKKYKIKNVYFYKDLIDEEFDITLMLNVHMWIRKQLGEDQTKEFMRNLKTKHLFFQTSHAESGGMYKVNELKNKEDIEAYLLDCGFRSKLIHTSQDHGGVRYMYYSIKLNK